MLEVVKNGSNSSLFLGGFIFLYFPQGWNVVSLPECQSQGQKPHKATVGFPKLAKVSQVPTKEHRFLPGNVIPNP